MKNNLMKIDKEFGQVFQKDIKMCNEQMKNFQHH